MNTDALDKFLADPMAVRAGIAAERARRSGSRSLAAFVKQAWHLIDPEPLVWNWHLEDFCFLLELVARNNERAQGVLRRLIANMPPRSAKSNIFSILWPAWVWIEQPTKQFLFVSHGDRLSSEHSLKCRIVVESDWYREQYKPRWKIRDDQNVKNDFLNSAGGRRRATSITGSLVGHGADIIAIDDPLDEGEAYSEAARQEAARVVEYLETRLNNPATGCIVLVMQRLHPLDPAGVLLKRGGWQHMCIPLEFVLAQCSEVRVRRRVVDPETKAERVEEVVVWRDRRTVDGELLFEARMPREVVERLRVKPNFEAQYNQRPRSIGSQKFKITSWRFWVDKSETVDGATLLRAMRPKVEEVACWDGPAVVVERAKLEEVILVCDPNAGRETEKGSFMTIHVWGKLGRYRVLLDRVHERCEFDQTIVHLRQTMRRWPEAKRRIIEGKAAGDSIISTLKNTYDVTGVETYDPGQRSKDQRATAMQPYQAGGDVLLPDGAPWLEAYIGEHAAFPNGDNDDDVDVQAMALEAYEAEKTVGDYLLEMAASSRGVLG